MGMGINNPFSCGNGSGNGNDVTGMERNGNITAHENSRLHCRRPKIIEHLAINAQ